MKFLKIHLLLLIILGMNGSFISCTQKATKAITDGDYGIILVPTSGDNQSADPTNLFLQPITIRLVTDDGTPVDNMEIEFRLEAASGVDITGIDILQPTGKTDSGGFASTEVKAGNVPDVNYKVIARVPYIDREIEFSLKTNLISGVDSFNKLRLRTTRYYTPTTSTGTHRYQCHEYNNQTFRPEDMSGTNGAGCSIGPRNYLTAGENFSFELVITDAIGNIETSDTLIIKRINFSFEEFPSWNGTTNNLPDTNIEIECNFWQGVCNDLSGLIYQINNEGVTRVWASDGNVGAPGNKTNLHDATGIEIYVQPQTTTPSVVIANGAGGPNYSYTQVGIDVNRSNAGSNIYTSSFGTANDNETLTFHAAYIDQSGNYLRDYINNDITWSYTGDNIYSGNRYGLSFNLLTEQDNVTTQLIPNKPNYNGSLHLAVQKAGNSALSASSTLYPSSYTFSIDIKANIPTHILAETNACSTSGNCKNPNDDSVNAGAFSPVDISIKDKFDNTCKVINGHYDTMITIDRFNSSNTGADPSFGLPLSLYPNSSGSAAGSPIGGEPIISYQIGGVTKQFDGKWILDAFGSPTIDMYFQNGKVDAFGAWGLKVNLKDSNFRPFVHVQTQTHTFNSGGANEIVAQNPIATIDYTTYVPSSYNFGASRPPWWDIYPQKPDDVNKSLITNNPISIYRGAHKTLNLRYSSGKLPICKNGEYIWNKFGVVESFTPDECRGIRSNNTDITGYNCPSGTFEFCQLISTTSTPTAMEAVFEDGYGNFLELAPVASTTLDTFGSLTSASYPSAGNTYSVSSIAMGNSTFELASTLATTTVLDNGDISSLGSFTNYFPYKVTPDIFSGIQLTMNTNVATDSNQFLIIKGIDTGSNWVDVTETTGTMNIYFLKDFPTNTSGTTYKVPQNTLTGNATASIDGTTSFTLRDITINPFSAITKGNNSTLNNATKSIISYTEGSASHQVYTFAINIPKAYEEYWVAADITINGNYTFSAPYKITMTHGSLDHIQFHSNPEATLSQINYTTRENTIVDGTYYPEAIGGSINHSEVFSFYSYTFNADQNNVQICASPFDKNGNECKSCDVNKLSFIKQTNSCTTDNINLDTGSSCTAPSSPPIYISSVYYRAGRVPSGNCVDFDFKIGNQPQNIFDKVTINSVQTNTPPHSLHNVLDTRPSILYATWNQGGTNASGSIGIDITHGTYKQILFSDSTPATKAINDPLYIQTVVLADNDGNLVLKNEGTSPQDLDFKLKDRWGTILGAPNDIPQAKAYTFSTGSIDGAHTSPGEYYVIKESDECQPCKIEVLDTNNLFTSSHDIYISSGNASQVNISCNPISMKAGSKTNCTVRIEDTANNLITSFSGSSEYTLESSFASTITGTALITNGIGTFIQQIDLSGNPGTYSFMPQVTNPVFTQSNTFAAQVTVYPHDAFTMAWAPGASPSSPTTVNSDWPTVKVEVKDKFNNTLWNNTNEIVNLNAKNRANGSLITMTGITGTTSANGTAIFSQLKILSQGTYDIYPSYSNANGSITTLNTPTQIVEIDNPVGTEYVVISLDKQTFNSGGHLDISTVLNGTMDTITAGSTFTAKVYALDPGFNIDTSNSGTIINLNIAASNYAQIQPNTVTLTNGTSGIINITVYEAKSNNSISLGGTICGSITCSDSSFFNVTANTPNKIVARFPEQTTFRPGYPNLSSVLPQTPTPKNVAESFTINAVVTDQYHNQILTVSDVTLGIQFSSPSYSVIPSQTEATIINGVASFKNIKQFKADPTQEIIIRDLGNTYQEGTSIPYGIVPLTEAHIVSLFKGQSLTEGTHSGGVPVALSAVRDTAGTTCSSCGDNYFSVFVTDSYFNKLSTGISGSVTVKTGDINDQVTRLSDGTQTSGSSTEFVTDGSANFYFSSNVSGPHSLNIISPTTTGTVTTGSSNAYNVSSGTISKFLTLLPGQSFVPGTGVQGTSFSGGTTTAGSSFQVKLIPVDSCNAAVLAGTSYIYLDTHSSNSIAQALPITTTGSGSADLVSYKASFNYDTTPITISHKVDASGCVGFNSNSQSTCTSNSGTWVDITPSSFFTVSSSTAYKTLTILPDQIYDPLSVSGVSGAPFTSGDPKAGDSFNSEVRLVDEWNNTISTISTVTIAQATSNFVIDPKSSGTDFNTITSSTFGITNISVTNYTATTGHQITVDTNNSFINNNSASSSFYSVNYNSAYQTIVLLPKDTGGLQTHIPGQPEGSISWAITGTASEQTAGIAFPFMALAVDKHFNTVQNYNSNVTFSNFFNAVTHQTATFSSGTILFNNSTAGQTDSKYEEIKRSASSWNILPSSIDGSHYIHMRSGLPFDRESSLYKVMAGPAKNLIVLMPGEDLIEGQTSISAAITGTATDQTAAISYTATVISTDKYFNRTGDPSNISLDMSTDPHASSVTQKTLSFGTYGFSVLNYTANTHPDFQTTRIITPIDVVGSTYTGTFASSTYNVKPGAATKLIAKFPTQTFDPGSETLDTALDPTRPSIKLGEATNITLYDVDSRFNVVQSTDNITLISSNNSPSFSINPTSTALVDGTAVISLTDSDMINTSGRYLTFTHASHGFERSQDYVISYGSVDHFAVYLNGQATPTSIIANVIAGTPISIKLEAQDSNNNTVLDFTFASGLSFSHDVVGLLDAPISSLLTQSFPTSGDYTFSSGILNLTQPIIFYDSYLGQDITISADANYLGSPVTGASGTTFNIASVSTASYIEIINTQTPIDWDDLLIIAENSKIISTASPDNTFWGAAFDQYGNYISNVTAFTWNFYPENGAVEEFGPGTTNPLLSSASVTLFSSVLTPGAATFSVQLSGLQDSMDISVTDQEAVKFKVAWETGTNATVGIDKRLIITALNSIDGTATSFQGVKDNILITSNAGQGVLGCSSTPTLPTLIDASYATASSISTISEATVSFTFNSGIAYIDFNFPKTDNSIYVRAHRLPLIAEGSSVNIDILNGTTACRKIRTKAGGSGSELITNSTLTAGQTGTLFTAEYDIGGNYRNDTVGDSYTYGSGFVYIAPDKFRAQGKGASNIERLAPNPISIPVNIVSGDHFAFIPLLKGVTLKSGGCDDASNLVNGSSNSSFFNNNTPTPVQAGNNIQLQIANIDKHCNLITGGTGTYLYHEFTFVDASSITDPTGVTWIPDPFDKTENGGDYLYADSFATGTTGFLNAGKIYNASSAPDPRIVLKHCQDIPPNCTMGSVSEATSRLLNIIAASGSGVPDILLNGATASISDSTFNSNSSLTFSAFGTDPYGNSGGSLATIKWSITNNFIPFILGDSSTFNAPTFTDSTYLILDSAYNSGGFSGPVEITADLGGFTNKTGTFTIVEQDTYSFSVSLRHAADTNVGPRAGEEAEVFVVAKTQAGATAIGYSGNKQLRLNILNIQDADNACSGNKLSTRHNDDIRTLSFANGTAAFDSIYLKKAGVATGNVTVDNDPEIGSKISIVGTNSSPSSVTAGKDPVCIRIFVDSTSGQEITNGTLVRQLSTTATTTVIAYAYDQFWNPVDNIKTTADVSWAGPLISTIATVDPTLGTNSDNTDRIVITPNIAVGFEPTTATLTSSTQYETFNLQVIPGSHSALAILMPGDVLKTDSATTGFDCTTSVPSIAIGTTGRGTITAGNDIPITVVSLDDRCNRSDSPGPQNIKLDLAGITTQVNYLGTSLTSTSAYQTSKMVVFDGNSQNQLVGTTFYAADNTVSVVLNSNCPACAPVFTTASFTVQENTASHLVFNPSTSPSVTAGICSGITSQYVTVQSQDSYGNSSTMFASPTSITFSSNNNSVTFFSSSTCGTPTNATLLTLGQSDASMWFKGTISNGTTEIVTANSIFTEATLSSATILPDVAEHIAFKGSGTANAIPNTSTHTFVAEVHDQYHNLRTNGTQNGGQDTNSEIAVVRRGGAATLGTLTGDTSAQNLSTTGSVTLSVGYNVLQLTQFTFKSPISVFVSTSANETGYVNWKYTDDVIDSYSFVAETTPSITAGVPVTFTLFALDAAKNILTDVNGSLDNIAYTFSFNTAGDCSSPFSTGPNAVIPAAGSTFSFNSSGSPALAFASTFFTFYNNTTCGQLGDIKVIDQFGNTGSSDIFTVSAGPRSTYSFKGFGTPGNFTFTAGNSLNNLILDSYDSYGNLTKQFLTDTLSWSTAGGVVGPFSAPVTPPFGVYNFSDGSMTDNPGFTFYYGPNSNNIKLTVSGSNGAAGTSSPITILADTAEHIAFKGSNTGTASKSVNYTLIVDVHDKYHNLKNIGTTNAGVDGTASIQVINTGGGYNLGTLTGNTGTFDLKTVGSHTLTFQYPVAHNTKFTFNSALSIPVSTTANETGYVNWQLTEQTIDSYSFVAETTPSITAGDSATFSIYAVDNAGNILQNVGTTFNALTYTFGFDTVTECSGPTSGTPQKPADGGNLSFSATGAAVAIQAFTLYHAINCGNDVGDITVADSNGATGSSGTFDVAEGALASFVFDGLDSVGNYSVGAGSSFDTIVRIADAFGNPLSASTNPDVTWSVANGNPLNPDYKSETYTFQYPGPTLSVSVSNGTYTQANSFTFYNASDSSNVKLVIKATSGIAGTSPVITITPDILNDVVIRTALGGGGSNFDATTFPKTADETYTMYCAGYDQYGNFKGDETNADWSGSYQILTGDLSGTSNTSTLTFTARTAGANIGEIFCNSSGFIDKTELFTIYPGTFDHLNISAAGPGITSATFTAGQLFTFTAVAKDLDSNNLGTFFNPINISGYSTTGTGTTYEGTSDQGFNFTILNFTDGTGIKAVTFYSAESKYKTYTIIETSTSNSGTISLYGKPAGYDHYTIRDYTGFNTVQAGSTFGLTVDSRDSYGNLTPDSDTFTLLAEHVSGEALTYTLYGGNIKNLSSQMSGTYTGLEYPISHEIKLFAKGSGSTPDAYKLTRTFAAHKDGLESFSLTAFSTNTVGAGSGVTAQIIGYDVAGNIITGIDGSLDALAYTISCPAGTSSFNDAPNYNVTTPTFTNGSSSLTAASFTFYKEEIFNISNCTVSAEGTSGSGFGAITSFTVNAGTFEHYTITTTDSSASADSTDTVNLTIESRDKFGNLVNGDSFTMFPESQTGKNLGTIGGTTIINLSASDSTIINNINYDLGDELKFTFNSPIAIYSSYSDPVFTFHTVTSSIASYQLTSLSNATAGIISNNNLQVVAMDIAGNTISDFNVGLNSLTFSWASDIASRTSPDGSIPTFTPPPGDIGLIFNSGTAYIDNEIAFVKKEVINAGQLSIDSPGDNVAATNLSNAFTVYSSTTSELLSVAGVPSFIAGTCNQYNINRKDRFGNVVDETNENIGINISSLGDGSIFLTPGCTTHSATVTISSGTDATYVFIQATKKQTLDLSITFAATTAGDTTSVSVTPSSTNYIKIQTAASNSGYTFYTSSLDMGLGGPKYVSTTDPDLTLYAASFDQYHNFIADASADWSGNPTGVNFGPVSTTTNTVATSSTGTAETKIFATLGTGTTATTVSIFYLEEDAFSFKVTMNPATADDTPQINIVALKTDGTTTASLFGGNKNITFTTDFADSGIDTCSAGSTQDSKIDGFNISSGPVTSSINFTAGVANVNSNFRKAETNKFVRAARSGAFLNLIGQSDSTLTVTAGTGACVQMRTLDGGSGSEYTAPETIYLDDSMEAYAAKFDNYGNIVTLTSAEVTWSTVGPGLLDTAAVYTSYNERMVSLVGVKTSAGGSLMMNVAGFAEKSIGIDIDSTSDYSIHSFTMDTSRTCDNSNDKMCNYRLPSDDRDKLSNNSIVASYYYDASASSNDSWRLDSGKSWYTMAKDDDRGDKSEFPSQVFIVANTYTVHIIDAKTNKLWMRVKGCGACPVDTESGVIKDISAIDGKIIILQEKLVTILNLKDDVIVTIHTSVESFHRAHDDFSQINSLADNSYWDHSSPYGSLSGSEILDLGYLSTVSTTSSADYGNIMMITSTDNNDIKTFGIDGSYPNDILGTTTQGNGTAIGTLTSKNSYFTAKANVLIRDNHDLSSTAWNLRTQIDTYSGQNSAITKLAVAEGLSEASSNKDIIFAGGFMGLTAIHEGTSPATSDIKHYTIKGDTTTNNVKPFGGVLNIGDGTQTTGTVFIPKSDITDNNDSNGVDEDINTIEFRFMPKKTIDTFFPNSSTPIIRTEGNLSGKKGWQVTIEADGGIAYRFHDGSGVGQYVTSTKTWTANTWYHIVIMVKPHPRIVNNTAVQIFVNGVNEVYAWTSFNTSFFKVDQNIIINQDQNISFYLDELLIAIKDQPYPWNADIPPPDITIPVTPYADNLANCVFLFHFDEAPGNKVKDSCQTGDDPATSPEASLLGTPRPWISYPLLEGISDTPKSLAINTEGSNIELVVAMPDTAGGTKINKIKYANKLTLGEPIVSSTTANITDINIYQSDNITNYDMAFATTSGFELYRQEPEPFKGEVTNSSGSSCLDIFNTTTSADASSRDGWYWIDIGTGSHGTFLTYCDMENGGWTRLVHENPYKFETTFATGSFVETSYTYVSWTAKNGWDKGGNKYIHGLAYKPNSYNFDLDTPGFQSIKIKGRGYAFDTWNGGNDFFEVKVQGNIIFSGSYDDDPSSGFSQRCIGIHSDVTMCSSVESTMANSSIQNHGSGTDINGYWYFESIYTPSSFPGPGTTNISFDPDLDQTDESAGVDNITIWIK